MCSATIHLSPAVSACTAVAPAAASLAEAYRTPMTPTGAVVLVVRAALVGPQDLAGSVVRLRVALAEREVAAGVAVETETRWQLAAEAATRVNAEARVLGDAFPPVRLAGSTLDAVLDRCEDLLLGYAPSVPVPAAVLAAGTWLEGLLVPGVPGAPALVDALTRVVSGAGRLTPSLRRRTLSMLGRAERVAAHGLVLDHLRPALLRAGLTACEDARLSPT